MSQKGQSQNFKITPQEAHKIPQLDLVANTFGGRSYTSASSITVAAIDKFRRTGRGLTYMDLMNKGIVIHKKQAQETLKYHLMRRNLFALADKRPQQYFPTKFKSEITKKLVENSLVNPSGVDSIVLPAGLSVSPLSQCLRYVAVQTLEGYVLPLLPEAPLLIHNMHFKTKISPESYGTLKLPYYRRNSGKHHQEIIGKTLGDYVIYKSGTVDILAATIPTSLRQKKIDSV